MNRYPPIGHPPMPIPRTTRFRPSGPVITPDPEPSDIPAKPFTPKVTPTQEKPR